MTEPDHSLSEQAARCLGISVDPASLPGIDANLALLRLHAAVILAVDLPADCEPAPVFAP